MRLQNKNIDRTIWKLYGTSDIVTSLEFMIAEVKCPFFIDKFVDSWQIFSFFKQTRLDIYDFLTDAIKGH